MDICNSSPQAYDTADSSVLPTPPSSFTSTPEIEPFPYIRDDHQERKALEVHAHKIHEILQASKERRHRRTQGARKMLSQSMHTTLEQQVQLITEGVHRLNRFRRHEDEALAQWCNEQRRKYYKADRRLGQEIEDSDRHKRRVMSQRAKAVETELSTSPAQPVEVDFILSTNETKDSVSSTKRTRDAQSTSEQSTIPMFYSKRSLHAALPVRPKITPSTRRQDRPALPDSQSATGSEDQSWLQGFSNHTRFDPRILIPPHSLDGIYLSRRVVYIGRFRQMGGSAAPPLAAGQPDKLRRHLAQIQQNLARMLNDDDDRSDKDTQEAERLVWGMPLHKAPTDDAGMKLWEESIELYKEAAEIIEAELENVPVAGSPLPTTITTIEDCSPERMSKKRRTGQTIAHHKRPLYAASVA